MISIKLYEDGVLNREISCDLVSIVALTPDKNDGIDSNEILLGEGGLDCLLAMIKSHIRQKEQIKNLLSERFGELQAEFMIQSVEGGYGESIKQS